MNRTLLTLSVPSLLLALACNETTKPVESQDDVSDEQTTDDSNEPDASLDQSDTDESDDSDSTTDAQDAGESTTDETSATTSVPDAGDAFVEPASDAGDDEVATTDAGGAAADAGDDAGDENTPPRDGVYVIESLLFGDDGSKSYVILLPNLGAQPDVTLEGGREFGGFSPADVHDGKVIVGSGEAASSSVFELDEDLSWDELGSVGFSNYTSEAISANVSVSSNKIYTPIQVVDFLTWDPNSFELGQVVSAPDTLLSFAESSDLLVRRGYSTELRGDTLFQPYYFSDDAYGAFAKLSQITVVDTQDDVVTDVLDVDCPHLHITSQDADGNIYVSNGQYSIAPAVLTPDHPKNCFVRINAGETTVDPDSLTYFADIAEGREGSNFFPINGDLALFNVYHAERDELTEDSELSVVSYSANYHLWTYNLSTHESAPMEGIDYAGGQFVAYRIEGKVYLTVPKGDYSETAVYEISNAGKATKLFDVEGWGFKLLKVR